MDYLTLCQTTRQRAGISGVGPAQVTGQSGELGRVVDWVRQAWLELQSRQQTWRPLWREMSLSVTADQATLAAPSDLGRLATTDLKLGDTRLRWYDWRDFPRHEVEAEHPVAITRRPDGQLMLWPTPSSNGTLTGEYYATPQTLDANDDEPWLPEHLQDAIVYQAIFYYGIYEDAPELYQDAMGKVKGYEMRMVNELLPPMELFGGPVA